MVKWLKRLLLAAAILVAVSVIYVAVADSGTLSVHYADSKTPAHQQIKASLEQWRGFDATVQQLDDWILFPTDVQVWFADCGQANAFYQPDSTRVVICYELIRDLAQSYARYAVSDSARTAAVWQTTFFVFYHEIGHALIHVLGLPVTGREEDAVDQLATIVLLNGGDEGRNAALQGGMSFRITTSAMGRRAPYWDQHALGEQRYYNVLCWVYGSNPEAHQALLGRDWGLPRERAASCDAEYQRMARAWGAILEEHTM